MNKQNNNLNTSQANKSNPRPYNAVIHTVRKVTIIGSIVNILLAIFKSTIGYYAGSKALIADGIHSFTDLISDFAILWGSKFWNDHHDERHPYGHYKIETLVTLSIALLLCMAAFSILYSSVKSLQHPTFKNIHPIPVIIVAAISVIAKEILYQWTNRKAHKIKSKALAANAWHHRSDALSSIPVVISAIFSYIQPDFAYFDSIAAVIVCIMLFKAAWSTALPCINELLDTQGDQGLSKYLESLLPEYKGLKEFHKIRSRSSGNMIFVDMHMLVDGNMSVGKSHDMTKKIEAKIRNYNKKIIDITIHVEPAHQDKK